MYFPFHLFVICTVALNVSTIVLTISVISLIAILYNCLLRNEAYSLAGFELSAFKTV